MGGSLLITFATKYGSTREVAESIAKALRARGFATDVEPVAQVHDPSGYDGIVLGTALYMGRPHVDARRFLRRHHETLSGLPVAVFGMGPLTTAEKDVAGAKKQLDQALAKVSDITPISTAIFGGVVKPDELHFPFNHMQASDARDWTAIEAWAGEIGSLLAERGAVVEAGVR